MEFEEVIKPTLVEPGVKSFLNQTLKQCRHFKNNFNNILFNILLVCVFLTILGSLLIYKYKGKLNPKQKEQKNREKQQYILTKIKNYQNAKRREQQELITGLPNWDNEFDLIHKNNLKYI